MKESIIAIVLGIFGLWVLIRLSLNSYFDAKERFVDRLMRKENIKHGGET